MNGTLQVEYSENNEQLGVFVSFTFFNSVQYIGITRSLKIYLHSFPHPIRPMRTGITKEYSNSSSKPVSPSPVLFEGKDVHV